MEINTIANTAQRDAAIQHLYIISGPYITSHVFKCSSSFIMYTQKEKENWNKSISFRAMIMEPMNKNNMFQIEVFSKSSITSCNKLVEI